MKNYEIGFEQLGVDLDKLNSTGYTICPECSHQRKQGNRNSKVLKVYLKTGYYDCKHCDFNGRVDSNEWIQEKHGIETGLITKPTKQTITQNNTSIKPFILAPLIELAYEYLQSRGISKKTATSLQLGYKNGCLAFNYYEGVKIIGAKYRKMDSKFFWQHAGCEKILYNINNLKGQDEIMLVEGEFDVMAVYESGFHSVGSVSQGAPNAGQHVGTKLQCLDNSIKYIKDAKKVLIWTDNDINGIYLKRILIERFGADRCAVVEIPEDLINKETGEKCKDANDVLMFYGVEKIKELIKEAKDTPISGVRTLKQVESEMWETYRNGYRLGVKTNIRSLDKKFSFYKPWWNLYYGIPNSGKSELTLFLMVCMSVEHGWKWACFVPEAYPAGDFYNDCVSKLTGRGVDIGSNNRLTEQEYQIESFPRHHHSLFVLK
jgi:twinkle protein